MCSTSKQVNPIFNTNADGSVIIRGRDFTEVIRPWGHPDGFGCSGCHREEYNGEARPLFLIHALRFYGNPDGRPQTLHRATAEPIDRIARTVPKEVLKSIYHLAHWPIELIQLAETNVDGFIMLAKSNPALLCLIARTAATHSLWGPRYWGEHLIGRDENDITRQLGYGSPCAGYLRKIREEGLCAHGYLDLALTAWQRPGMARLLVHVPRVTLDVMTTALNHWAIVNECPTLLHVAADTTNGDYSTEVCEAVESIVQIRRSMRRPTWPWRKFTNLQQLRKLKVRVEQDALKEGKLTDVTYPAPPISPCSDWKWISCLSELQAMGVEYNNCAESHHWRCISGQTAVYVSRRTSYDETIIVVLNRSGSKGWEVSDILGPSNALVDDEEQITVLRHFQEALNTEGGAE